MKDDQYLVLTKKIVRLSLNELKRKHTLINNYKIIKNNKEVKTKLDKYISNFIIKNLSFTNIECISEENKNINFKKKGTYWIIDPIDGTSNLHRGLLSSSISIALCIDNNILFGVIGTYPELDIIWGGARYGSYKKNKKIQVSKNKKLSLSILATGFPTMYNFNKKNNLRIFNLYKKFSKIRMIGSASLSLVYLSEGKLDYYFEKNIRLWDIAAGLAILQGAGGKYNLKFISLNKMICEISASNGSLKL